MGSPSADEGRQIAANMRGIGAMPVDLPEWKRYAFGGNQMSYGKKTELTILEQRASLPIYKLKEELVQVGGSTTQAVCLSAALED